MQEPSANRSERSNVRRSSREVAEGILDTAAQVFGEKGFESTRVTDIARRCGLSTGAIYSRWLSKRELFVAAIEQRGSNQTRSVSSRAELTNLQKLAALGGGLYEARQNNDARNLLLEACVSARRDSSLKADIAGALDIEADLLTQVIAHGKAAGEIDQTLSTQAIVLACQSLSLGVRLAATAEPRSGGEPTSEEWSELIERFVGSIQPTGQQPTSEGD